MRLHLGHAAIGGVILLAVGCRTVGPQTVLKNCEHCHVYVYADDSRAAQGKAVSGELSPARSVQARDNQVPISGM